jgi:hypothetical protein
MPDKKPVFHHISGLSGLSVAAGHSVPAKPKVSAAPEAEIDLESVCGRQVAPAPEKAEKGVDFSAVGGKKVV